MIFLARQIVCPVHGLITQVKCMLPNGHEVGGESTDPWEAAMLCTRIALRYFQKTSA